MGLHTILWYNYIHNTFTKHIWNYLFSSEKCPWEMSNMGVTEDITASHSVLAVLWLRAWSRINLAKQWPHGTSSCCSSAGIWLQKWKNFHLTFIICVLVLSIDPPFIKTRGASEVAKNGVSLLSSKSLEQTFLGAGRWTVSPSKACKKSAHAIIFGCQRKSFRKISSASSAPSHANDPVAGLQNVL